MTENTKKLAEIKQITNELSEICDLFYCVIEGGYIEYNTNYAEFFINCIREKTEKLKSEMNGIIPKKAG